MSVDGTRRATIIAREIRIQYFNLIRIYAPTILRCMYVYLYILGLIMTEIEMFPFIEVFLQITTATRHLCLIVRLQYGQTIWFQSIYNSTQDCLHRISFKYCAILAVRSAHLVSISSFRHKLEIPSRTEIDK